VTLDSATSAAEALPLDPDEVPDYALPRERIALYPAEPRDSSRLLMMDRRSGALHHGIFRDLPAYLRPGDVLVLNDTRVRPARLHGRLSDGRSVEVLLLRRLPQASGAETWSCLARPARTLRPGTPVEFPGGVVAECLGAGSDRGERVLCFPAVGSVERWLEEVGETPLPPYIRRGAEPLDRQRYQTVYARVPGSVAAPTAGLHFTPQLLERLREAGVRLCWLTLHVGPATFRPLAGEAGTARAPGPEEVQIPPETASAVRQARAEGRKVVAVGTTTVRALEGAPLDPERGFRGEVSLFIRPGFCFRWVDGLITNFHLPRSSLLLLVCAFAGREAVLEAYRVAIERGYRFYSYGDAMFVR
jgi:S-adenosylmethionine:tRNA ribosyltransferase-isomerase